MKATITATSSQAPEKLKKEPKKRTRKSISPVALKRVGRKSWVPDFGKIENWASQGLKDNEIAALSGICHEVFSRKKNQLNHPELKNAIDLGKAKGVAACCQKLLSMALSGNERALIFYLERIGGRRNTIELERPKKPIHLMTDKELLAIINGQLIE